MSVLTPPAGAGARSPARSPAGSPARSPAGSPTPRPGAPRRAPVPGAAPSPRAARSRPRRLLHPVAWWLWALGLAAAATHTTDPLLLGLVIAVAGLVVAARRTQAPWADAYRAFLLLGLAVVAIRTVFAALLSPIGGGRVLLDLPVVTLPAAFAGIRLGGPVTVDGIAAGATAGLQLAALLACVGAANALAHPLRLLKVVPGALYEVGVAVVVAVTAAPAMLAAVRRVRTARRLRGRDRRGPRALAEVAIPVLHASLEGALDLAASMDARGYGRRAAAGRGLRALTAACTLGGLLALLAGLVSLLDGSSAGGSGASPTSGWSFAAPPGAALLAAGILATVLALALGSRRTVRTRYRPDRWLAAECLVTAAGLAAAVAVLVSAHSGAAPALNPSTVPLQAPGLPLLATVGILLAALPAVLAPPPPTLGPALAGTPERPAAR